MTKDTKQALGKSMKKLEEIANWFENQEEIDIENGIEKAKEGASLLVSTRKQLDNVENEFKEIKKTLQGDRLF